MLSHQGFELSSESTGLATTGDNWHRHFSNCSIVQYLRLFDNSIIGGGSTPAFRQTRIVV
jgi:hypothetical protein